MGEQQNGGGAPGRRRAHPGAIASGHGSGHGPGHDPRLGSGPASATDVAFDDAALEALLSAAVLRGHRLDADGEQRAVAAFRAARDAGVHRARTRRRDDWRPREQRWPAFSVKTTLSVFVASLTLGGAAFAAMGTAGFSDDAADDKGAPTRSSSASDRPGAQSSAASGAGSAKPDRPVTARDTEAKCRAYDHVKDNGKALDSTAWQRLVTAAGGADKVAAYCAQQLAAAKNGPNGKSTGPEKSTEPAEKATEPAGKADTGPATGNGQSRGESGNGNSGKSAEKKD
ncbi:hypothetical protein PGH47_26435 [Streptomyces sp. HUAS 31]|uniref:hypothetical protein n=1 Tax=Streptomyces TaxID=1883 RepID=UPI0023057852|nr:hypothetical protein [Streptomyces sp. HUAS 31]WCD99007.1 hypothetical protein PGH47_26435 [Streptomyces sp. HUAS 31]